jgi:hypothetical protein
MPGAVEETAEAVPVVELAAGPVGQVVLEAEAAVALPATRQRSKLKRSHPWSKCADIAPTPCDGVWAR